MQVPKQTESKQEDIQKLILQTNTPQQPPIQSVQSAKSFKISFDGFFAPTDTDISLLSSLDQLVITNKKLLAYYTEQPINPFVIKPISIISENKEGQKQQNTKLIFVDNYFQKYLQVESILSHPLIYYWIVEIFSSFATRNMQSWPKINKQNIEVKPSPFWDSFVNKDQIHQWNNPFCLKITSLLTEENQFIKQIHQFGQLFSSIEDKESLQAEAHRLKYGKWSQSIFSIANTSLKIKTEAQIESNKQPNKKQLEELLGRQDYQWLLGQIGQVQKLKPESKTQASFYSFAPQPFWSAVLESKPKQLVFVLQISMSNKNRFIAFYTPCMPLKSELSALSEYISDTHKKSTLFNLAERTSHSLNDQQNAYFFNKNILLGIGKFDIVLSAFNATNLCYFPVSYNPDNLDVCVSAGGLCGSKRFELKDLYVFSIQSL